MFKKIRNIWKNITKDPKDNNPELALAQQRSAEIRRANSEVTHARKMLQSQAELKKIMEQIKTLTEDNDSNDSMDSVIMALMPTILSRLQGNSEQTPQTLEGNSTPVNAENQGVLPDEVLNRVAGRVPEDVKRVLSQSKEQLLELHPFDLRRLLEKLG
jgi:predicted transcriptional regulator